MAAFSVNQLAIQRYCSLPTIRDARRVIYATIVPYIVLTSIGAFIGLIALAYFYDCNPLETGEIRNEDQLIILFAKQVLCKLVILCLSFTVFLCFQAQFLVSSVSTLPVLCLQLSAHSHRDSTVWRRRCMRIF